MEKLKKILSFLQEFDFIWSIPVAFLGFYLFAYYGETIFGEGFAFYPPSFFHAGIYAGLIVVLFNSLTQMGIYINFPVLYKYYLQEGFELLPTWQKAIIFILVYLFFFFSLLTVWSQVV
jgi:hypothetical protein